MFVLVFFQTNNLNAKVVFVDKFSFWNIYKSNETCFIASRPKEKALSNIIRFFFITNTSKASNEISLAFWERFNPSKIISNINKQKYKFFRVKDRAWLESPNKDQSFLLEILNLKQIYISVTENNVNYEHQFPTDGLKEALRKMNKVCKYKINTKIVNALEKNKNYVTQNTNEKSIVSKRDINKFEKEKEKRITLQRKAEEEERKRKALEKEIAELKKKNKELQQPKKQQKAKPKSGSGSGFFISKLGHIITNQHVVNKCKKITIGDHIDKQVPAKLLEADSVNDLALLRTTNIKMASTETQSLIRKLSIQIVPLASGGLMRKSDVKGGEDVIVAGFPYGVMFSKTIKVTKGIVSSTRGAGDDSGQFQIDAAVQPGNSGGPIYDRYGNIVGVVVAQLNKFKMAKSIGSLPENVNFGIKASTVSQFLNTSGVITNWAKRTKPVSNEKLFEIASKQTVMVVCHR